MKFKLYESPKGTQNLMVFQRGQLVGEYSNMDEVNTKIAAIAQSHPDVKRFDSEEWPINSGATETVYFIHTRIHKENTIETLGHILIIEK